VRAATRFFFLHVGSFVSVGIYFALCERAGYSAAGVAAALPAALVVALAYGLLAWRLGELKYFDVALATMFGIGTLTASLDDRFLSLFQTYSPAILFATLGLSATVPPLLGRESFAYHFARRQVPRWQQQTVEFPVIIRLMTALWGVIFFSSATLCAVAPREPLLTLVVPNLLVFVLGIPAAYWLPRLYLRLIPPALPHAAAPLIMGMPLAFRPRAASNARALIQFHVTGEEPGRYYLDVRDGRCRSFEGEATGAHLTITTPDTIWVRIAHGALDRVHAIEEGLLRADGDLSLLAKLDEWFAHTASTPVKNRYWHNVFAP
jgi:hypothetical protein